MRLFKLKCSFCGKDENNVAKLVAGPRPHLWAGQRLHICNECVALASSYMRGDGPPPEAARTAQG